MAVLVTPLYVAEIVTSDVAETDEVVIVNTGDAVAPAATVTDAGATTPGSLLVKVTLIPPAGAGPVRFTLFNVADTPPTTDAGESATESNATGLTVRIAVLVTPLYVAEIVTGRWPRPTDVVIVKYGRRRGARRHRHRGRYDHARIVARQSDADTAGRRWTGQVHFIQRRRDAASPRPSAKARPKAARPG